MAQDKDELTAEADNPPQIILDQAYAAAAAQNKEGDASSRPNTSDHHSADHHTQHHHGTSPHLDHVPKPAYDGADYGQLDINQNGLETGAKLAKDGRINININQKSRKLSNLLVPALRKQLQMQEKEAAEPEIPEGLGDTAGLPPPPMNIVIQIVGSRGDVQPFVALGQVLKNKYNHRVRIATHPTFRDFVTENGLEFFSIGGDPSELMAFMVKNPGLMPGMDSLKNGDVGKRRKGIYEIITGCWRSCIEAGDGTGVQISDDTFDTQSFTSVIAPADPGLKPFVADAIIANPPSFAHMHIAEKLGIPLHLMFTMPWSPTQAFPHPLANIISSNADPNMANFVSYALVDMLTWQGLGDVINKFRERSLGLEPVSIMWAPGMAARLRIPWTYCWSPALIPKPADWGNYIDISGFYFLNLATNYTPAPELQEFLDAGPPPVYIGFGSIVVDDPNAMTKMIFEAVKKTGQRALVSKGWGGLGADEMGIPEGVFMLGNCPHDWLFKHVSCVVHHGGAGTTAAGISAGRPTVVVPFFGDQPFWGAMCARAGAGPMPIPYKQLTADKLASQINEALKPASLERAAELSEKIRTEHGTDGGADSFHKQLHLADLRCSLSPTRVANWKLRKTDIRLSSLAATVLGNEGLIDFTDLELYRPREYETEDGPWEPISGGAAALIGTLGNLSMGVADFPVEILKSLKGATHDVKEAHQKHRKSTSGAGTPVTGSNHPSTTDLSKTDSHGQNTQSSSPSRSATATMSETPLEQTDTLSDHSDHRHSSPENTLTPQTSLSPPPEKDITRGRSTSNAMSTVLTSSGERRHSSARRILSHSRSPSRYGEEPPCPGEDVKHITHESVIGGAKAAHKIVSAGVKSPMDFTLSLAKGFHNAPKLYGDTTVRKSEKITDFQSGVKAATKEFGYGFYDGITGLVTQPIAGAKKEGAAGFIKGAAKGFGGLILKPGAGIWGIPGYTAKGLYAEIAKQFGSSVSNYIIAARTAQGYEDWKNSSPEEREEIVAAWRSTHLEKKRAGKKFGEEKKQELEDHIMTKTNTNSAELVHGFKNTRHLTWDERKALAERKEELKKREKELNRQEAEIKKMDSRESKKEHHHHFGKLGSRIGHHSDPHLQHVSSFPNQQHPATYGRSADRDLDKMDEEFEAAIQRSVTSTSRGDPREDAMIERALRASVKELNKNGSQQSESQQEAYQRAIKASVEEARKARGEAASGQETGTVKTDSSQHDNGHDAELERALTQSLEEYHTAQGNGQHHAEDNSHQAHVDPDTEDDEDYKRTLEQSKESHENEQKTKLAQIESARQEIRDEDQELQRAITASEQESKKHEDELNRQRTEEEIVLDYVKKQSLLEEEHKKNHEEYMKDVAANS